MKKLEYAKILYPKSEITITVPNRIHMFTYRASFNVEGKTGGAGISIKGNQIMNVRTMDIQYYNDNPLLDYFISVFKRILKYDGFFKVDYKNALEEHIGLGTSISQTVALCFAINHLFYNPHHGQPNYIPHHIKRQIHPVKMPPRHIYLDNLVDNGYTQTK